jgi:hypothetical protein
MRLRTTALSLLSIFAFVALPAQADFTPIAQPVAAYTSSTTLVDISSIPDFTTGITSVTQGSQTLSFDSGLTRRQVPVSWSSWNTPPAVENPTPPVLMTGGNTNTLQILLSQSASTFGFELEGNQPAENNAPVPFSVSFFSGATLVGTIAQGVPSVSGALLFAGSTTTSPFTSVVITNTDGKADGFAIAQLRYTQFVPVPEPASIAMVAQAIAAIGFYGWRKRRQAAREI